MAASRFPRSTARDTLGPGGPSGLQPRDLGDRHSTKVVISASPVLTRRWSNSHQGDKSHVCDWQLCEIGGYGKIWYIMNPVKVWGNGLLTFCCIAYQLSIHTQPVLLRNIWRLLIWQNILLLLYNYSNFIFCFTNGAPEGRYWRW